MEIVLSYLFDFTAHWVTSIFGVIVIVISRFLTRYSKAKCTRASAYSRALRQIKGGYPKGPSIKYVTLFLANFDTLPLSHFVTYPGTPSLSTSYILDPPPMFSRPSAKALTKAPCTNALSIARGGFCPGLVFYLEGFVRGAFCPFPLLSECMCYNRNLNITLTFMFHMYDKKCISVLLTPSPCHKLPHLLG